MSTWSELLFWAPMSVCLVLSALWLLRIMRRIAQWLFDGIAKKWQATVAYTAREEHLRDIHHTVDYRHLRYHVRVFDNNGNRIFTFYSSVEPRAGDRISYQNGPPQDTQLWYVRGLDCRRFTVRPDKCYQIVVDLVACEGAEE